MTPPGPLAGLTVLVPRARGQAGGFSRLLRERGAEALEVPAIEIRPVASSAELDRAVEELAAGRYDWVVLTSRHAVEQLFDRLEGTPPRVAVVGPGTADALRERGIEPTLVASRSTQEGLLEEMPSPAGRVLSQSKATTPRGRAP